jgi:DNA-binding response OmpR family regulator
MTDRDLRPMPDADSLRESGLELIFEYATIGHRKSKIVMGVDRTPDAERMERAITGAGYTFLHTENGVECLALVARIQPRLIIIEIDLPHLNGFETCKRLRADTAFNHIPIAIYTNRNAVQDVRESIDVGANDYILKSAGPGRLLSRVNHWTCRFVRPVDLYRVHSPRRMLVA